MPSCRVYLLVRSRPEGDSTADVIEPLVLRLLTEEEQACHSAENQASDSSNGKARGVRLEVVEHSFQVICNDRFACFVTLALAIHATSAVACNSIARCCATSSSSSSSSSSTTAIFLAKPIISTRSTLPAVNLFPRNTSFEISGTGYHR